MPDSRDTIARSALEEITRPEDIGEAIGETEEDGVVTVRFAATMLGYPGWAWTVSLAELPGEEPSVLEAELLPGDGALIAPDWVPWSERMEDLRAQEEEAAAGGGPEDDVSEDDVSDDDDDSGEDDSDDDASDDDDDFGDDVYDGLDPESAEIADGEESALDPDVPPSVAVGLPDARVDEPGEPEGDADDDGPEPEPVPARE